MPDPSTHDFDCFAIMFSSADHRDEFMTYAMLKHYNPVFTELVSATNLRKHDGRFYAYWFNKPTPLSAHLRPPVVDILEELRRVKRRSYAVCNFAYDWRNGLRTTDKCFGSGGKHLLNHLRNAIEPVMGKGSSIRLHFHGESLNG